MARIQEPDIFSPLRESHFGCILLQSENDCCNFTKIRMRCVTRRQSAAAREMMESLDQCDAGLF